MFANVTRKLVGSLAVAALSISAVGQSANAVFMPNAVNFELRAKNGGNQGIALESFLMDKSGADSNVLTQTTIVLGQLNGGPSVYGQGWTTGPEAAGTRGHINGGVAPSSSTDNIIAAYSFAIYDNDGVFQFTENIDDRVRISVNGTNFHNDGAWNTRTSPIWNNDDAQGGGWYDVDVYLVEDGGGAGKVGSGLGFAFDHTADFNFYLIDGGKWLGDIDPSRGYGLATHIPDDAGGGVPEPATAVAGLMGLMALGIRRRRKNA